MVILVLDFVHHWSEFCKQIVEKQPLRTLQQQPHVNHAGLGGGGISVGLASYYSLANGPRGPLVPPNRGWVRRIFPRRGVAQWIFTPGWGGNGLNYSYPPL